MVNSQKLKNRAKMLGIRQKDIAEALGIKAPTVSQKLGNVRPMTLQEAEGIASLLKIPNEEFAAYFFDGAAVLPVSKQISGEEWVLIEKYRQLPRRLQLLMQALMMPKASEKERGNDGEQVVDTNGS